MKKIVAFILCVISLISCQDDITLKKESIYKNDILTFLNQEKINKSEENILKIDELSKAINFYDITSISSNDGINILIADVADLKEVQETDTKVVFYANGESIFALRIIDFEIEPIEDFEVKDILMDLHKQKKIINFSGKVSVYNLYQKLTFYNKFKSGSLIEKGEIKDSEKSTGGRTKRCIAWYLVTTYYYTDGTNETTSEYLYTTCDCAENTTRGSKVNCGGGAAGGGGGSGGSGYGGGGGGHLCGTVGFVSTGNGFTAQITHLGISGVQSNGWSGFNIEFGVVCVTIPGSGINQNQASELFKAAFNYATDEIGVLLNSDQLQPYDFAIRPVLIQEISSNLNSLAPGSAFSTGPCLGSIPTTQAQYVAAGNCN